MNTTSPRTGDREGTHMAMPNAGRRVATALILTLLASAAPAVRGDAGVLVEGGASPGLLLMYTGDVIGYIDPCG
jgi:hypothetical protein